MKNFKKAFSLIIVTTFLCQSAAFCLPDKMPVITLRPPMQSSPIAKEFISRLSSNENLVLSKLEEYLKIEGTSTFRANKIEKDKSIVEEIRKTGSYGISVLKSILETDKRTWMRAKAAILLAKLYTAENKEILGYLLERLEKDKSVMVRSIIARGSLPEIRKKISETTKKEIEKKIRIAKLDPWPRKNCLQILDIGCQFGEASAGILEHYRKKGFSDTMVVGIDLSFPSIIEAEKNKKDPNLVFILADTDEVNVGQADIVFSMNLLLDKEEMAKHAKSLAKHLNPEGGIIYYTPSIYASGEDGIMSAWELRNELKNYLPKIAIVNELKNNPFGIGEVFGSPWDEGAVWINAALPEAINIGTDKNENVKLKTLRFPDGELYLRILNPGIVKDASLTVSSSLNSSEDLVKLVLLMDLLKRKGAKEIRLVLDNPYDIKNGLDSLLRFYCDKLFYNDIESMVAPLEVVKKDKGPHLVNRVLYQHGRLETDAEEAANYINASSERIEIVKPTDNPLSWYVNIKNNLKGENVILVHSTENAYDFTELWIILMALRQKGVNSISLINTYKGYSRQDHEFNPGEAVSAETMVKIEDALVDNNSGLTIHYATQSGRIHKNADDPRVWVNSYDLVNLNAFIQPAEALFDKIAEWSGKNIAKELRDHPLVLVGPDDGAAVYAKEAIDVLKSYIKKKYNIDVPVSYGYLDKKRIGDKEVEVSGKLLINDDEGNIINVTSISNKPINACWMIILDDETSWGTTLLAATYALVRETGVAWPRVLTGVVHGKLARGLELFKTGYSQEEIIAAVKEGRTIEPKEEYINEAKKLMPPRFFAATKSVALPKNFPENQAVSIGPIIAHAAKEVFGKSLASNMSLDMARDRAYFKALSKNTKSLEILQNLNKVRAIFKNEKSAEIFIKNSGGIEFLYLLNSVLRNTKNRSIAAEVKEGVYEILRIVFENPYIKGIWAQQLDLYNSKENKKVIMEFLDGDNGASAKYMEENFSEFLSSLKDPRKAKDIVLLLSLYRLINYRPFLKEYERGYSESLEYALENNIYIPIGKDLYVTPLSESFRRCVIFRMNSKKEVKEAVEMFILGDYKKGDRHIIDRNRIDISKHFSKYPGLIKTHLMIEYPYKVISRVRAYGDVFDYPEKGVPFRIFIYDYSKEMRGRRLLLYYQKERSYRTNISNLYLARIRTETQIPTPKTITLDVLRIFYDLLREGYYLEDESSLENFRLCLDGTIRNVGDTEGVIRGKKITEAKALKEYFRGMGFKKQLFEFVYSFRYLNHMFDENDKIYLDDEYWQRRKFETFYEECVQELLAPSAIPGKLIPKDVRKGL